MGDLIGYARVSTNLQVADRQVDDLRAAGVREEHLFVDIGRSGAHARRPELDRALEIASSGDTFAVCTLDRLGRSVANMLELAELLRDRGVALRVLNLGGGEVNTREPMGRMVFTVMAALAEMELDIKRERIRDSVAKRRRTGGNLGGAKRKFTEEQIRAARALLDAGETATKVAADLGMSRETLYRRVALQKAYEQGADLGR